MKEDIKHDLKTSVCWILVFIIMLFCSAITGIDGIFMFIGYFALFGSIFCLLYGIVNLVKNKVENTNTYINMKEKQEAKRIEVQTRQKQKVMEAQKRQEALIEVQKRIARYEEFISGLEKSVKLYKDSIKLLKQNYRHAISLKSRQMRMKAYKELQDSLIFAEVSFEAMMTFAREMKSDAIFIKDTIKNEKLPLSITSADYLIELADKVLSLKIEDDEDYMDIKYFCEEELQGTII